MHQPVPREMMLTTNMSQPYGSETVDLLTYSRPERNIDKTVVLDCTNKSTVEYSHALLISFGLCLPCTPYTVGWSGAHPPTHTHTHTHTHTLSCFSPPPVGHWTGGVVFVFRAVKGKSVSLRFLFVCAVAERKAVCSHPWRWAKWWLSSFSLIIHSIITFRSFCFAAKALKLFQRRLWFEICSKISLLNQTSPLD